MANKTVIVVGSEVCLDAAYVNSTVNVASILTRVQLLLQIVLL
jgi:hypothetical protein